MERLDKLFDAAANLLSASEKNEQKFAIAIELIERNARSANSIELDTKKVIKESTQQASNEIVNRVSEQLLKKLEKANIKAEQAALRYERASKFSILKISFVMLIFLLGVTIGIWFLLIKDIPTINEIKMLRIQKESLQIEVDKLNKYGYISQCGGNLCISVDDKVRYESKDKKNIFYIIAPKDSDN